MRLPPPEAPFRLLIQVFTSMMNGCSFCYYFPQTQATKTSSQIFTVSGFKEFSNQRVI